SMTRSATPLAEWIEHWSKNGRLWSQPSANDIQSCGRELSARQDLVSWNSQRILLHAQKMGALGSWGSNRAIDAKGHSRVSGVGLCSWPRQQRNKSGPQRE